MKENFLHYVWKNQLFNKENLWTVDAKKIDVFKTGTEHTDSGPDFMSAHICINNLEWYGNVEIHIFSSDWIHHNHSADRAYDNVILHVVYENDKKITMTDGSAIPVLELKERIDESAWNIFQNLMKPKNEIPCQPFIHTVNKMMKINMFDKALMERLNLKAEEIQQLLLSNKNDWEETTYQLIARNYGLKINTYPFFELSRRLPYKLLLQYKNNLNRFIGLILGQAGFLEKDNEDIFLKNLADEFNFLKYKHSLKPLPLHTWKFLRLRPNSFPLIRLIQFGLFLYKQEHLFNQMIELNTLKQYHEFFQIKIPESSLFYWNDSMEKKQTNYFRIIKSGKETINNMVINTVSPILMAYSNYFQTEQHQEKAVALLQECTAEDNSVTRMWKDKTYPLNNAYDTQSAISLINNYCKNKMCLHCHIGGEILGRK